MFNFKNFGPGFKAQSNNEIDFDDDKAFFIGLMTTYTSCLNRSEVLMEKFGINLMDYEEPFVSIIENLIYKHYGELRGDIMIWYVYDRLNFDGTPNPIIYEQDGEEQQIIINTPEELWEFFETKLKNKEDNNE